MKFNTELEFDMLILPVDNTSIEPEKIFDWIEGQFQQHICPGE